MGAQLGAGADGATRRSSAPKDASLTMERDPDHPIVDEPWRYQIGAMHYHVGLDGSEAHVDLDLHLDGVVRRLRFMSPQQFVIEDGFPQPTHGMAILDVGGRRLEGLRVWVTDFECNGGGISFWARDVLDRDSIEAS